jgi:UDP-N-acetyl-D-galactosamine dehydrogenase
MGRYLGLEVHARSCTLAVVSEADPIGRHLKKGAMVVYESTAVPGATEEIRVPILERQSGFKWKRDFFVGYSPERISPGDKEHSVTRIAKVVSRNTSDTLAPVSSVYESVITAGVHEAASIQVAEVAKVVESTLGVDPYYPTRRAEELGYNPQVILVGRRINDGMAQYTAQNTVKGLIQTGGAVKGSRVNAPGLTFTEACPDPRNSKVADVIRKLEEFGCDVGVHEPLASPEQSRVEHGVKLTPWDKLPAGADALMLDVAHPQYLERPLNELSCSARQGLPVWRL